ncbi:MAG: 16S rRNA (guanine(527)-N(7))-methyltransferase RsmG [Treponema sp.]|nr:16S rRNA (guanine(527)-N(7))-methyltransferase RsmG [Treponema sp.]
MKDWKNLLREGIKILRKNDEDFDRLAAARNDEIIPLLERYVKEIELFNPAYRLVGTTDTNEIVIKHILDSLSPLGILSRILQRASKTDSSGSPSGTGRNKEGYKIADAGSGAGLPGIPLAIVLPECYFTLIERMKRRAGFLLNTEAALALSNLAIEENELEKIAGNNSSRFDLITFRAFKPMEPKLLKTLYKVCAPEGFIAAYKGKLTKIEEEMKIIDNKNWEAIPYTVPFLEEERHLVVIKCK